MTRKAYLLPLCGLLLTATAVSSCRIVNGKMDFSLAEDRVSRPIADEVILESSQADLAAVPTPIPAPAFPAVTEPTPRPADSVAAVPPLRPVPQGVMSPVATAKAGTYTVKKGDTLLTLESMKMENAIKAEQDGKVTKIVVSAGQSVMQEDVLMVLG